MKRRILSLITAVGMILSLIVLPQTASADTAATELKLGDYVQMGEYNGSAILWRCVAFEAISGYDDDGNPITDSTNTKTAYENGYLPLMLADSAICNKAFDAKGSVTSGSHNRDDSSKHRANYGSNYWGDSNIRDWLNSSASAGNVAWTCGNKPSSGNVKDSTNPYDSKAGFLTNFTVAEKAAMKTVTQKSLLAKYDAIDGIKAGGSAVHAYKSDISEVVQNYSTTSTTPAYYENITDTIFLLDVQQLYNVYKNDATLGSGYYKPASESDWLRSPSADDTHYARNVGSSGSVTYGMAYIGGEPRRASRFLPKSVICSLYIGQRYERKSVYRRGISHYRRNNQQRRQPNLHRQRD